MFYTSCINFIKSVRKSKWFICSGHRTKSHREMTKSYRIASIPGDGIGIEVTAAAVEVVEKLAAEMGTFKIEFEELPWGTAYYKKTGKYMEDGYLERLSGYDAILFGSVGAPDVADHVSLWGLLLPIRGGAQLYVNVRPVRLFAGVRSPLANVAQGDLDWVLIRENSEGEYAGHGGRTHVGQDWETATETAIFTRHGIRRIMRFAFETAASRKKHLVVVTKSNSMRHGLVLWDSVAEEVGREFREVKWEKMLVDAMTVRMVNNPRSLDTIVGTNLHMDILSDLAAALAGSIGIAPSSNLDPSRKFPSLFEPVHGSAFDIAGKGVANPVGALWSASEMLKWIGEQDAGERLIKAVEEACRRGRTTRDLGGQLDTAGFVQAVIQYI